MAGVDLRFTILMFSAAIAWGCGPETSAPNADDTSGDETGPAGSSDDAGSDDADHGPPASAVVGTWLGAFDGLNVQSGSDRMLLEIAAVMPDGQITGTVQFGNEGTLPPATNPDVGYPEGAGDAIGARSFPVEQFVYELSGSFDDGTERLVVSVQQFDVWSGWCAMQTSYPTSPDSYGCIPNCGTAGSRGGCAIPDDCEYIPGPIDCGKMNLCDFASPCACDVNGCTSATGGAVELDLRVDADELSGAIDGQATALLTRQ